MDTIKVLAQKENIIKISDVLKKEINLENKPVFMCVGSDKVVADSLGPIVGEILKKRYNLNAYIYGNLDYNINATNLVECYNYIKTIHPHSQIILIDATLGDNVGEIIIGSGAYAGMGKNFPLQKYGDISVLGVVSKDQKNFVLNSVKMQVVLFLTEIICTALNEVFKR